MVKTGPWFNLSRCLSNELNAQLPSFRSFLDLYEGFDMEKFHKKVWGKELGRKKKYYIEKFNPTCDLQQKEFIGASISWREKALIAQLRTNSHQLWCEIGQWKRPKEAWDERVCTFCMSGAVESEKHFILECDAFKDIRESYENMLTLVSWHYLFSKGIV